MSEETRTMQTADTTPTRAPEDARAGKENQQDHLQGARPFQPDQHPFYVDTGTRIESAAELCWECLNDVAMDVMELTGNDHDIEDADPLELAEIKRRWKPYIDQLPEYAYICDDLLSGSK